MRRTPIYLSEKQHAGVATLARERGVTNSDVIRAAIDAHLAAQIEAEDLDKRRRAAIKAVTGIWADRTELPDWEEARRSLNRDVWNAPPR